MAWVNRNGQEYYYRSKRVDGKVRTEVFSGLRARSEAAVDERERKARQRELAEEDSLDEEIDRIFAAVEEFTAERLAFEGFHQHKREWRRRRNKPECNRKND